MTETVYIGIGSNLDSSKDNCVRAIEQIQSHDQITLTRSSSFYETAPVGIKDQNWFVNAVIEIQTTLPPSDLLSFLLSVENKMGRVRNEKWGPRIIDLDILFYGQEVINQPGLQVPHPEAVNRSFVLIPMAEVAGDFKHPTTQKSIRELLQKLPEKSEVIPIPSS